MKAPIVLPAITFNNVIVIYIGIQNLVPETIV